MEIKTLRDPAFRTYGRVIKGYDTKVLEEAMAHTPLPEDVVYVASVPELEALPVAGQLARGFYGQMEIQVGYCNGHNKKLNAVEYHRSSELDLAVTDMVLLLGRQQDITDGMTYETRQIEAFFVPAGTLVELYATTLHYAPCQAEDTGFRCVVVLPRGTNTELAHAQAAVGKDELLFARNKWLIGHREGGLPQNAWIGLEGENISL